jgi:hypothetical protein
LPCHAADRFISDKSHGSGRRIWLGYGRVVLGDTARADIKTPSLRPANQVTKEIKKELENGKIDNDIG